MCAREEESAAKAINIKAASQLPVEYYSAVALFKKYPTPAVTEIDQAALVELRAELWGQRSCGKVHGKEQIKGLGLLSSAYGTLPMQHI